MSEIKQVGMIGLGNMGGRIVQRIGQAGWSAAGYDVDPNKRDEIPIKTTGSVVALTERSDVVFLSLPDSTVVERVIYGEDGLLAGCRSGQIVVDLSTADPESSRKVHADLDARQVQFLDAGISGGAAAAEKGTLTIMLGGSHLALEQVRPVMESFAQRIFHMGGPGLGHTTKLLNNFLNGISLAATAEVMVAARKAELDLHQLLEVINSSSGVNFATLNRFPKIVDGDYLEGGLTSNLMAKDIQLYLRLAQALRVTSFTGPPCLGTFHLANALGYGDQISNRVVDAVGDICGGVRLHDEQGGGRSRAAAENAEQAQTAGEASR